MESKRRSDAMTSGGFSVPLAEGMEAVSEFPGNGMWDALHYLFEIGLNSASEHINKCY